MKSLQFESLEPRNLLTASIDYSEIVKTIRTAFTLSSDFTRIIDDAYECYKAYNGKNMGSTLETFDAYGTHCVTMSLIHGNYLGGFHALDAEDNTRAIQLGMIKKDSLINSQPALEDKQPKEERPFMGLKITPSKNPSWWKRLAW